MLQAKTNIRLILDDTTVYNTVLTKEAAISATETSVKFKVFLKELVSPADVDETALSETNRDAFLERFNTLKYLCKIIVYDITDETWDELKFKDLMKKFRLKNDNEDIKELSDLVDELRGWALELYPFLKEL